MTARGLAVAVGLVAWGAAAHADGPFPYQDPDRPAEERITDLVGRLTLQEKIACMAGRAADMTGAG